MYFVKVRCDQEYRDSLNNSKKNIWRIDLHFLKMWQFYKSYNLKKSSTIITYMIIAYMIASVGEAENGIMLFNIIRAENNIFHLKSLILNYISNNKSFQFPDH